MWKKLGFKRAGVGGVPQLNNIFTSQLNLYSRMYHVIAELGS